MRRSWLAALLGLMIGGCAPGAQPAGYFGWRPGCLSGNVRFRYPPELAVSSRGGSTLILQSPKALDGSEHEVLPPGTWRVLIEERNDWRSPENWLDQLEGDNPRRVSFGRTGNCTSLVESRSEEEEWPGAVTRHSTWICSAHERRFFVQESHWLDDRRDAALRRWARRVVDSLSVTTRSECTASQPRSKTSA